MLESRNEEAKGALRQIETGVKEITALFTKRPLDEKRLTAISKDWTYLFRGVDRQGILPPYESLYRTGKLQEKPAREVHRLFYKMGVRVPDEWHQPPDYIGVELDYMRLLCSKEAEADSPFEMVEAERLFIDKHLGLWATTFCEKMLEQAQEDYFRGIARVTASLIEYDRIYLKALI